MRVSASARRPRAGAGDTPVGFPTRLPRAHLEQAVARLTEENARLRHDIAEHGSLWRIAHQDPLTELWNRRYADVRLTEEISRTKREDTYKFSMVVVDVDNLKRINDDNGHTAGDEALKWVARFLKQGLRGHDLCCRWGGDEFLLVLPGSGEQETRDLVERLRRRWRDATATNENVVAVSMGTASFPNQGPDVEALLVVADTAMYLDKRRHDPAPPTRTISTERAASGVRATHRLENVVVRLRRLLVFAACLFGLTCATGERQRRSDQSAGRGLLVSARASAIAIVVGPVLLHAYADTSGTRVYLAPAVAGGDADCALPPGAAPPEAEQMLRRNQSLMLAVPTGSIACASAGEGKPVEILWHAVARREEFGPITAQRQGPAPRCCTGGR